MQPAPSEYMDSALRMSSSGMGSGSDSDSFHLGDLHLGHIEGGPLLRGTQRWPHLPHSTCFLVLTFHSVDLQDGHLWGDFLPRLVQVYPHTRQSLSFS